MKQEDKKLLLKDLCSRLPYGFTIHRYSDNVNISIEDIDEFAHFLEYSEGEDFKPYLRPMSSMTEEEKKEYDKLFTIHSDGDTYCENWEWMDFMNSHHFDYRGLIEKSLAIEAPEGTYN